MSAINIIQRVARKLLTQNQPKGVITIPNRMTAEAKAGEIAATLQRAGLSMNRFDDFITSETDLIRLLNQIEAFEKNNLADNIRSGIRNTESAKVFDLKGKQIKNTDNIMGGEAMETEAEIAARLQKQNKDSVQKILERKNREDVYGLEDYDTTNMSEIKKEIIRTETKLGNLNPNTPGFRERAKPLIDKITALQKKLREDKADGGRIGFFKGAVASGENISPGTDTKGNVRDDNPFTGGGGGGNNNNPPPFSTNNTTPDITFFDKTSKSGLMNTLSPSILARLARMRKGITPILTREDVGLQYQNIDELNDILTNFRITQDVEDLIKDRKLNLDLKYKKEIGDDTFIEGGINKKGDANIFFKKEFDNLSDLFRFGKADGGRIGFFMGSQFPKGLATLREMLKFFSKGKDKERSGSEILRLVNPKQFNKLLEDPNIYRKFDVQKGIGAPDLIKNMQADQIKNRIMMVEEILGAAKNIRKADVSTMERKKEMIEEMIKRGIDRETAEEMANSLSTMAEAAAGMKSTPKLTDEGILELENILKNMETGGKKKRDLNADGGRIGLKDGMNRRTFLKLLGGLASIPIIGKIIKPLKTVKGVKNVPIIKTDNVAGKPEWFDQLVNKVIIEGDDVTKRFATGERQSIHQKTLDDGSVVRVTEDVDDGAVRVEYESEQNVFGDTVQMQYKKPLPDEGDPRPTGEFTTAESGPVGRRYGPDDYEIEVDEVGGTSIKDLDSDVSKLKQYATGKGPTMKEIVQNKKRKDKAKRITEDPEAQSDAVVARQGEVSGEDYMYASGGLARLKYQMGGDVAYDATDTSVYGSSAITVTPDTVMDQFGNQVQAEMGNNFNKPLIPQVTEQASNRPETSVSNQTPIAGAVEQDIPVAGGNKNEMGIPPVMPVEEVDQIDMTRPPGTPSGDGALTVMPRYNDPLPKDQLLSGFEEYKKTNPPGAGTAAIVPVTLPGGYSYNFSGSAEANAFAQYLQSIGQAPYQRRQDPEMLIKFASGGIARMLGE